MATRIFVVEDDADSRALVRRQLLAHGSIEIVGEVVSGQSAIDRAALFQPDVILLDVRMPGMSGIEAIPELRRRCPNSRIVVMSAYGGRASALEAGADAFAPKSSGMNEVIAAVLDAQGGGSPPKG